MKDPSPGVVLLFEATRYQFEGEDKKKLERVRRFYSSISETVELQRLSMEEAGGEARALARRAAISIDPAALDLLVEALGGDVARIAVEIEKLSLFSAGGAIHAEEDIAALVPDARSTTIFALVNALGRRDAPAGWHSWTRCFARAISTLLRVPVDAIPPGAGSERKRAAQPPADSGALRPSWRADVGFARRADFSDGGEVFEITIGASLKLTFAADRTSQCPARRPHRDGAICSAAD